MCPEHVLAYVENSTLWMCPECCAHWLANVPLLFTAKGQIRADTPRAGLYNSGLSPGAGWLVVVASVPARSSELHICFVTFAPTLSLELSDLCFQVCAQLLHFPLFFIVRSFLRTIVSTNYVLRLHRSGSNYYNSSRMSKIEVTHEAKVWDWPLQSNEGVVKVSFFFSNKTACIWFLLIF